MRLVERLTSTSPAEAKRSWRRCIREPDDMVCRRSQATAQMLIQRSMLQIAVLWPLIFSIASPNKSEGFRRVRSRIRRFGTSAAPTLPTCLSKKCVHDLPILPLFTTRAMIDRSPQNRLDRPTGWFVSTGPPTSPVCSSRQHKIVDSPIGLTCRPRPLEQVRY